jgi:arylsulfatase A-like enzyme
MSPPQVGRGQTTTPPNILVFLVDDYDFRSLAMLIANGMMPNLARYFLQGGHVFIDSFSVAGFGGPSRATFHTGQYPQNHNVRGFRPHGIERMNQSSTVATWLQAAGYRTGHMGRYVIGYGWWTSKTAVPPGWSDWKTLIDPTSLNTVEYKMNINGTVVDVGDASRSLGRELHQVDVLAVLAEDFVRRAPEFNQPFFLVVSPAVFNLAVDPPYNVCPFGPEFQELYGGSIWGAAQRPAERYAFSLWGDPRFALPRTQSFNEADVTDKPLHSWSRRVGTFSDEIIDCIQRRNWNKFEGMRAVDDMIGYVMRALEDTGALSNTVAFFTADNGLIEGQHRVVGKAVPYDEANRVPLFVRTPQGTQPTVVSKLVLNTDLAPTFAELAGATPTHEVDGRSLVPLLQNPDAAWRRIGLIESIGDWDPEADLILPPTFHGVRTDRTKPFFYARYTTAPDPLNTGEMYDLLQDPHQMQNRFEDPAYRPARNWLEFWMGALLSCRGAGCRFLEDSFSF